MCARFAQAGSSLATGPFAVLIEMWGFGGQAQRHNIAPTQKVPVVRAKENGDGYRADPLRWGLVPSWTRELRASRPLVNARSETAAEKPSFRSAFKKRRCVVPASGFLEWKSAPTGKLPQYIFRADGELMLFAGLWESWLGPDEVRLDSFTVLTCAPNEFMSQVHDRMPVVLESSAALRWLEPERPAAELQGLLAPAAEGVLDGYQVSKRVNSVKNDDYGCLEPASTPGLFD
ncbi:MAG: putative SOS response-associated peptidase YedK [Chlamydiales bacterium]|jgi:putative SOS response-associated peptidase YedK